MARSTHRPRDPMIPNIVTRWLGTKSPTYKLSSSYIEEYPIFKTFNKKFFTAHQLPKKSITYRYNPKQSVQSSEIKKLVEKLIDEVNQGKKVFSDFVTIRKSNFNFKSLSGLLIVKCKRHPFVVKLFIENPETFIKHNSKGFEPIFFFYMAGGINRHLLGFTRVKNLEDVKKRINSHHQWSKRVTLPRKWFILPKKSRWIEITGTNLGTKKTQKIAIPATYCVISDWVNAEKRTSIFNRDNRRTCMKLCNYLEVIVDPHIDNFLIEKGTGKLAIVDTEHFLSVVGMKKRRKFRGYFSWYCYLVSKCVKAMFCRSKAARKDAQLTKSETELRY